MAFVNERMAEEEVERCLTHDRMVRKGPCVPPGGGVHPRNWTIDKERDIYLRVHSRGREEESGFEGWVFYWKGNLMWFTEQVMEVKKQRHDSLWAHLVLTDFYIPTTLADDKDEILEDLRAAIQVYADGGVYSTATEYTFVMDIEFCKGAV